MKNIKQKKKNGTNLKIVNNCLCFHFFTKTLKYFHSFSPSLSFLRSYAFALALVLTHFHALILVFLSSRTKPLTQAYLTDKPKIQPKYDVHRDVLSHDVVIKQTGYGARDKSIPSGMRRSWNNWSFLSLFVGIMPIVQWLPRYSLRRDAMGDLVAGITVAIMNIPHGMAYGILAGVTPGCGLALAIFPVLVYMILGTSRHISIGTFAVISMMTLKVVQTYATEDSVLLAPAVTLVNGTAAVAGGAAEAVKVADIITPIEVATALAFCTGLLHVSGKCLDEILVLRKLIWYFL